MGGSLTYETERRGFRRASQDYFNKIERRNGGQFPECKGFFPDCPEKPNLLDKKCRNCPNAEDEKIPRLEWVDCEHCKEEEIVPFDTNSSIDKNEDTKCHNCGKTNSAEWIKKQRVVNKI